MQKISCQVSKIEPLTNVVSRVLLTPESPLEFIAGQYLQVVMGDEDKRPFSIANAPQQDGAIELHIGAEPGNQYAGQVLEKMRSEGKIEVEGGLGEAFLKKVGGHPIILVAGGTGFSYTLSILQKLLSEPLTAPVYLYWGTRTLKDMYALDELTKLSEQHAHFTFVPVIEIPDSDWQGKTGWVHNAVLDEFNDLKDFKVFVAGRFEMAKVVRTDFCAQGLLEKNLYGDAYAFI
ncbi:NAD(P)H-flavin reductase [Paraglaciecola aquimarina]|uniref:NAD(P)H-flavin reductase n=1 Tax=Paraglaciecola algarum TaxID=3050085 RepID=A0ABS9DAA7_9ALTE|nr:NAD(P)H-flavin reductase [Paraglaciecola sp. G1-23]MCF2949320.1 NAD(P)H-flavin reductase [Paraglaciecola sp. G1-23]